MRHIRANLPNTVTESNGRTVRFRNHVATVPDSIAKDLLLHGEFYTQLSDLREVLEKPGARICLVRSGNIGDLLMMTPLIRVLAVKYAVSVDVFTLARCAAALQNNPHVSGIGMIDADEMTASAYDAVIDLDLYKPHDDPRHAVTGFASYLEAGIEIDSMALEYYPRDSELQEARAALEAHFATEDTRPLIAYAWRATHTMRSLTPEKNRDVLAAIAGHGSGYRVVLLDPVKISEQFVPEGLSVWNSAGDLDFRQAAAVIALADLVVTPDSGPLHLASALNKPTVAFFSTHPPQERITQDAVTVVNAPQNCRLWPCRGYACWNRRVSDGLVRCLDFDPSLVVAALRERLPGVTDHADRLG